MTGKLAVVTAGAPVLSLIVDSDQLPLSALCERSVGVQLDADADMLTTMTSGFEFESRPAMAWRLESPLTVVANRAVVATRLDQS